uniref:Uncharacterized protein n=1 Tax=Klebsiella pneumoniae TaxID=573 RepID=A0A8B0SUS2_KLEPN|nr:hypothetical protein [Klebsiella pneumoniae]
MFPLADMQNSRCLCAAQVRKVTFFLGHRHSTPAVLPNKFWESWIDTGSGLSSLSTCTRERLFLYRTRRITY